MEWCSFLFSQYMTFGQGPQVYISWPLWNISNSSQILKTLTGQKKLKISYQGAFSKLSLGVRKLLVRIFSKCVVHFQNIWPVFKTRPWVSENCQTQPRRIFKRPRHISKQPTHFQNLTVTTRHGGILHRQMNNINLTLCQLTRRATQQKQTNLQSYQGPHPQRHHCQKEH